MLPSTPLRSVPILGLLVLATPAAARSQELSTLSGADVARGGRMYRARCARCHGVDGLGGEGPTLARPFLRYARDDEALVSVVREGISGTGMPSNWSLSELEARQIAGYVRSLGAMVTIAPPNGDPFRGEALFTGDAACDGCHGPNGTGTKFGPDLTRVSARRSAAFIREAILDPGASLPRGLVGVMASAFRDYLPVKAARTAGAPEIEGHRINETSFAILVRDKDGNLHSFRKTELAALTKEFGQSLMPGYVEWFSDDELDDLVAYLISLRELIP